MRFLLLIFMVMMVGCASNKPAPKTLIPKKNGTTCASGNAQVCYNQGARYYTGDGVTQNSAKAIKYMERACTLGHANGCYWAARKYEDPDDPKLKNVKRARELYQHLCDHNYKQYCYDVANNMINNPIEATDTAKGVRLMDKLCKTNTRACWNLGQRYYFGKTLEPDNALAKAYFQKGCKANGPQSCHMLATWFKPAQLGGEQNQYRYTEKACKLGVNKSCMIKNIMMIHGRGTKKQYKLGVEGLHKLCKAGHLYSCASLAQPIAKGGEDLKPNPKLARELLISTCNNGFPRACAYMASWYDYEQFGTAFDIKQVLFYYQKACKKRSVYACINLGLMYKYGRGIKQDHKAAFNRFNVACDQGTAFGCTNMAYMYQNGYGVKQDKIKAKKILTHQCKNKVNAACVSLAYWQYKGINGPKDIKAATVKLKKICQQKYGECYTYGVVLKEQGNIPGAIEAFEKQCKNDSVSSAVDSCIELVKLGQTKHKARADKLKAAQCRRLYKSYCTTKTTTKENAP